MFRTSLILEAIYELELGVQGKLNKLLALKAFLQGTISVFKKEYWNTAMKTASLTSDNQPRNNTLWFAEPTKN